jgi:hypothetical protein
MEIPEKTVLWWSGGARSTRVLELLRQQPTPFDIVQQRDFWTKEQKEASDKLIIEWNLKVFSYAPADRYFIQDALVDDYLGLPIVRETRDGTQCIADLPQERIVNNPFEWDLHIVGTKGRERWSSHGKEFWSPLYDQEIEKGIDTGIIYTCTNCLKKGRVWCPKENKEIDGIEWSPEDNLNVYRSNYGLGTNN